MRKLLHSLSVGTDVCWRHTGMKTALAGLLFALWGVGLVTAQSPSGSLSGAAYSPPGTLSFAPTTPGGPNGYPCSTAPFPAAWETTNSNSFLYDFGSGDWSFVWGTNPTCETSIWTGGYIGGEINTHTSTQSLTLPNQAGITLTFEYLASMQDELTEPSGLDYSYISVNGTDVFALAHTAANDTPGYISASVDLSAYAGQTVSLQIGNVEGGNPGAHGNVLFGCFQLLCSDCTPTLEISCPDAVTVSCEEYNGDWFSGLPTWVLGGDCPGYDELIAEIGYSDEVISVNDCTKVIARVWTVTIGNLSASCTQLITVIDNQGPVFDSVPEDITVECGDGAPGQAVLTATDACGEVVEVVSFTSGNGSPGDDLTGLSTDCFLTTPLGPGPDGSIWLNNVAGLGLAASNFWSWTGTPTLSSFPDGTAHIVGDVINNSDASQGWHVDMWFENKSNWAQWSGLGRNYKDDLNLATPGSLFLGWDFYELVPTFSQLVGFGSYAGNQLYLSHQPSNYYFGFQCGLAANNRNAAEGMSGWFFWEGWYNGQWRSGNGDLFTNKQCGDTQEQCRETLTYFWRAQDGCGNNSFASQTITIEDTTPPVFIDCPEDLTLECDEEIPAAPEVHAQDACTNVTVVYLGESEVISDGPCYSYFTRTWYAEDECENRSFCVQTITIVDSTAPVFTYVPADATYECDQEVIYDLATAEDNCQPNVTIDISSEIVQGDCPQEYIVYRTFAANDGCGNISYAYQTITVVDTTAPVFEDYDEYVYVECADLEGIAGPTATDNCGEVTIELTYETLNSGGCLGVIQRTWTATDECGNSTDADQYIVLVDTTPPTINNPEDMTVECDQVPDLSGVGATDNCGLEVTMVNVPVITPGECPDSYVITWTFTATDYCENVSTATTVITVQDTTDPTFDFIPSDEFYECDEIIAGATLPTATDNCDEEVDVEMTEEIIPGECPNEYSIIRMYRAYDDCGNQAMIYSFVYVNDTTAPVFGDQENTFVYECSDEIPVVEPSASDNCGEVSLDYADYSGITPWYLQTNGGNGSVDFIGLPSQIFINGSNSWSGNNYWTAATTAAKSVVITFDWEYLTFDEPGFDPFGYAVNGVFTPLTDGSDLYQSGSGSVSISAGSTFDFRVNSLDDLFGDALALISNINVEVVDTECPIVDCFIREWTAVDECGNVSLFHQFILLQDTTAPEITGVVEIDRPCDDYDGIYVTATDNCSEFTLTIIDDELVSGGCQGRLIRTYQATDECDNSSTYQQIITLIDNVPPVLEGQSENLEVECDQEYAIPTAWFSDNCDDELDITTASSEESDGCTTVVTYTITATDNCNNSTSAYVTVTITDTTPPTVYAPYGGEFNCDEEIFYGQPEVSDNCDEDLLIGYSDEILDGNCPQSFTVLRTWTATDDCGNVGYGYSYYYVYDWTAPELDAADDVTVECDQPIPAAAYAASDNCGEVTVTVEESTEPGQCENSYIITRHYVATDECYNSTEAYQYVTVVDTTAPVFTGIVEIDRPCDDYLGIYVSASDNCDEEVDLFILNDEFVSGGCQGRLIRTYEAHDNCGNSSTYQQIITLIDEVAPVLVGQSENQLVECDQEYPTPTAQFWDNCDDELDITTSSSEESDGCTTVVTYTITATDNCNNSTSAYVTVTIVDTTAPIVYAPFGGEFSCEQPIEYGQPEAWDNCDEDLTIGFVDYNFEGECPQSYLIVREWTATDDCGNTGYGYSYYYVYDYTAPVIAAAEDVTVECDGEIPAASYEATDNCGEVTVEINESSVPGQCENSYILIRQYVATDECGNSSEATQYITVLDTTAPEFVGIVEIDRPCDDYSGIYVSASDNCDEEVDIIILNDEPVSGGCQGRLIRTYQAWDNCYNYATFQQIITLIDNVPPVLEGQSENLEVECDEEYNTPTAWFSDNCDDELDITTTSTEDSDGCTTVVTYTITATDNCNNNTSAVVTVTITDTTPPSIQAPADAYFSCEEELVYGQPEYSDNCDNELNVDYSESVVDGDCPQSYSIVRNWVVTDNCGNQASASSTIYVSDLTAPVFGDQENTFVYECSDEVPVVEPSATDNCGEVSLDYADYSGITPWYLQTNGGNGSVDFIGLPSQISINGSNSWSGNNYWTAATTAAKSVVITFDWEYLTFDEPGFDPFGYAVNGVFTPLTDGSDFYQFGSGSVSISAGSTFDFRVNSLDDLFGDALALISNINVEVVETECPIVDCFIREWTAVDECGNVSLFHQFILLQDTTAPVITGIVEIDRPCDDYNGIYVSATDNCSEFTLEIVDDEPVSGGCQGRVIRTYQATDECGNTSTYQQIITLIDNVAPVLEGQSDDFEVECDQPFEMPWAEFSDNCDDELIITTTSTQVAVECVTVITYTITATDNCNNSTSAVVHVTQIDHTVPTVYAPQGGEFSCDEEIDFGQATAYDFCDNDLEIGHSDTFIDGDCPQSYVIVREWTAADDCGNVGYGYTTYYIYDNEAPVFDTTPLDQYYECAPSDWTPASVTATDNCGAVSIDVNVSPDLDECGNGTILVTYTATDECLNSNWTSYTVYIQDTMAPELSEYPADMDMECGAELPAVPEITASDNCDNDVTVTYEEFTYGQAPALEEGELAVCNVMTPSFADGNPCNYPVEWSMALFSMPNAYRFYQISNGTFTRYNDGTVHLVAQMHNAYNATSGFNVDVTFANELDWAAWSTQSFMTSFKADCNGTDANHPQWLYYILQAGSGAELTGYGDYAGSTLNIVHAPSNKYFGFQLGDGANNLTPGEGFGGWFTYSGTFFVNGQQMSSITSGAGDFAVELDCCPDYRVVRCWTAVDCTGNITQHCQTFTFGDGDGGIVAAPVAPLAQLQDVAGSGNLEIISVNPNPASEMVQVKFVTNIPDRVTLDVVDMTGRKVGQIYTGDVQPGQVYQFGVNAAELNNGLYRVRLMSNSEVKTKQLSVIR